MKVLVDGHENRLSIHLVEGDFNQFKHVMWELSRVVGRAVRVGEVAGLWMQRTHFFTIPPRGCLFTFREDNPYFPCYWDVDLREFLPILAQWLGCENLSEFLYASAPLLSPVIEKVEEFVCKVHMKPLSLWWILPHPVPPLEATDDLEQMMAGGLPVEGTQEATTLLYRNYARFEVRRLTPGFTVFLSRIVIYQGALRKRHFHNYIPLPLGVENDPLLRRLRVIASSDGLPPEDRALAFGLLCQVSVLAQTEDPRDYNLPIRKDVLSYYRMVGETLAQRLK